MYKPTRDDAYSYLMHYGKFPHGHHRKIIFYKPTSEAKALYNHKN